MGLQEAVLRSQQKAKDAGAQFLYETKAVRLVHNDDNTEVTGVICEAADGTYIEIDADAVVLACGDIGANTQMYNAICAENYALGEYKDCSAMSGRDGSGIAMAMRIGTGGDMGSHAAFPMSPMEGAETIWLNKYGKRFCNEAFGSPFVAGVQAARQPIDAELYQIWDEGHWRELAQNQALGHFNASDITDAKMDEYTSKLEEAKAAGAEGANGVFCADDLETLASYLGLEGTAAENFVESVERYSQYAEAGKDEDYAKPADMMWPINEGPFYGEKWTRDANLVLVTLAGLNVDGDQAVLDQHFEPIPGLFATGNCSGGRFPLQYTAPINGISIGFATVLGAILGEHLADLAE